MLHGRTSGTCFLHDVRFSRLILANGTGDIQVTRRWLVHCLTFLKRECYGPLACQPLAKGERACVHPSTEKDPAHRSSHRPTVHVQPGVLGLHHHCRPWRRTSECRRLCQLAGSNRTAGFAYNTSSEGLRSTQTARRAGRDTAAGLHRGP